MKATFFGESHGKAVGGIIEGCPAGLQLDMEAIQLMLDRRAGRVDCLPYCSKRAQSEPDEIEWLSGLENGITFGTPIAFCVANKSIKSVDYSSLSNIYRPGHADYTYQLKYGARSASGGGRASARETVARVVAGAIAKQLLAQRGIEVNAEIAQIGGCSERKQWEELLTEVAKDGDSIGGIIRCVISGMPAGIGNPTDDKVQSRLAAAILSINACKGFDYGSGFADVAKRGSELNDCYTTDAATHAVIPATNHAGGLLGGITTGKDIVFRAVFKPTPSITRTQHTVDADGNSVELNIQGRHDVCVVPRAVPVVEAMAALAIIDYLI